MMKRFIALMLALTLVAPVFLSRETDALTTSNYVLESYTFTQNGTQLGESVPASYNTPPAAGVKMPQGNNDNASWAYAAIAVLEAAAKNEAVNAFNIADMASALSNKVNAKSGFSRDFNGPGNRAMVTAYLMRGEYGGPVSGMSGATLSSSNTLSSLSTQKTTQPVTGVVYIPDLPATAGTSAKEVYRNRIKNGVKTYGAVAASLFFDEDCLYSVENSNEDTVGYIYTYKNTYSNPFSKAADHTVAIIGWDDTIEFTYEYYVTTGTGDSAVTELKNETITGAFLVYDSRSIGGLPYWVSYDTILKGAYYIEGFYDTRNVINSSVNTDSDFPVVTQRENSSGKPVEKNPFAVTYEYDLFGCTGAQGFNSNTAYFANVFTVGSAAEALHAVSIFLTGEGNNYEIYLVSDYKDTDSLKNIETTGTKIASGSKVLPGYYTVPLNNVSENVSEKYRLLPAQGKKFAIVAKVTCANGLSPIPVQSTTLTSSAAGRSYISSNSTSWTDAYSQGQATVCLKAHVEKDIDIDLENIALAQTEKDDGTGTMVKQYVSGGTYNGKPLLTVSPGLSYNIGPILNPINANNVIFSETKWAATMDYYERGHDGYLKVDENGDLTILTGELVWDSKWKMFIPESLTGKDPPSKMNQYWDVDAAKGVEHEDYIEPPINLVASGNAFTLQASKNEAHFGKQIKVTVEVYTCNKDATGAFVKKSNGDYELDAAEEASVVVEIKAVGIESISLDKEKSVKAGSSVTLKATTTPSDASVRSVIWCVAENYNRDANDNYTYTHFANPYNPQDPYNPAGPIATVSDTGKVTGLRNGVCYVYAKVEQDGGVIYSSPCKITVAKTEPTGISVNKKKMNMSAGTFLTLTATVKPANASNKRVMWVSSAPEVVEVLDERTGVLFAKTSGTAKITATVDGKSFKAECVITVTKESTVIKSGKSANYAVLGAPTSATVEWSLGTSNAFSGEKSGTSKYKVTASDTGTAALEGSVTSPQYNIDGSVDNTKDPVVIRKQSWNLASCIPISKLQMQGQDGEQIKKVTLCVDPKDASRSGSITVSAALLKPDDATLLDFEWTSKKENVATVTVDPASPNGNTVTINAVGQGSTKITAMNYNGKKKVSITVKVLLYPSSITTKSAKLSVVPGKSTSVKGKPQGKSIFKELKYTFTDSDGDPLPEENQIISFDAKRAKITALGEGQVFLTIQAAPYDSKAAKTTIAITVAEKKK